MKVRILLVGKTQRGMVADGVAEYLDRARRMVQVDEVVLPEAGAGAPGYQQRIECERIMASVKPGERLVALDERGVHLTSPAFAERLGKWRDQGVKQTTFVVGGAYGLTDEVRERADLVLALSAMTFPHQLVRVLFAEQLYRAYSILHGAPYHH